MNLIAAASHHPRSSELESVQQKLSRALQTIEVAARTSNDILYEWNIHGESSWRGGLGAILGLHDRVPVTYDFWKSLLHVEDEARVLASLEGALRGRSDRWSCSYRMRRADGSYATVLDRVHIFRDDSGGAQRLVGWLIDLSAQISLGEQLVEAERRYHALFAQSIDAMVFTAADGTFIDANPAALRMFGLRRELLPRFQAQDAYVDPGDRLTLARRMAAQGAVNGFETRLRRANGETFLAVYSGTACRRESDGSLVGYVGVIRDITASREAEEQLRRSEERLKRILETSSGGTVIVDRDGRIEYANPAAEQILGLVQAGTSASGRTYDDPRWKITDVDGGPFPPERLPFAQVMATGRAVTGVVHAIEWPDGTRVVLSINGAPLTGADGTVTGMVASMHDITERMRIENALRQRERELNTVLEHSPDIVSRIDRDLRHVYVNSLVERYTGMPAAAMIGKTNRELGMPAELCDVWEADLRRVFQTGRPLVTRFDFPVRDGVASFEAHLIAEFDSDGRVASVVAFARDVTALRRTQAALESSEARFRAIIENAHEVVALIGRDGVIKYVTPSVELTAAAKPADIVGRALTDFMPVEDRARVADAFTRVLRDGGITEIAPYRVVLPARTLWAEARLTNMLDHPAIDAVVMHARDVTSRVAAEEARVRAEEQFRQAQKMEAIGRLAGGVAHDFNNLLTAIITSAELACDTTADPELRGDLETIRSAGYKAAAITRQLLAFSRSQVTSPRLVDVNETILGVEKLLRRLVRPTITFDLALDAESPVHIDPVQLEQALLNLVVNANDAMPDGGTLSIRTCTRDEDRSVVLEVRDTGVGIEDAVRPRLFEPFFTTKPAGHGTGLGLPTVYGIVEQAGGRIEVDSAPGKGSTFRIFLPAREGEVVRTAEHRVPSIEVGGTETVLVVDDEASVRQPLCRALRRLGYQVIEAKHGQDALTLLSSGRHAIDLVVTDLVMPEMGGAALVKELRAASPSLPVIFVSGYSRDADAVRAPAIDASFLQKPFPMSTLVRTVRECLDRRTGPPIAIYSVGTPSGPE